MKIEQLKKEEKSLIKSRKPHKEALREIAVKIQRIRSRMQKLK
jgi:prefoldin subunit 5